MQKPDLLHGADDIAEFLYGDRKYRRRVYHLVETRQIPVFRLGGRLTARRSTLVHAFEKLEGAACSSEPQMAGTAEA